MLHKELMFTLNLEGWTGAYGEKTGVEIEKGWWWSQGGGILGRSRGLRGPSGNAKGSGAWVTKAELDLVYHGTGVVSVERGGFPESRVCPWRVGLKSGQWGCDTGACFAGCGHASSIEEAWRGCCRLGALVPSHCRASPVSICYGCFTCCDGKKRHQTWVWLHQ